MLKLGSPIGGNHDYFKNGNKLTAMAKDIDILQFIKALRESDEYIETIFLNGSCYRFHLLLKKFFPECEPFISDHKGHIISEYKGKYYDVTGEVSGNGYTLLDHDDLKAAKKWSFYKYNSLKFTECPNCEEPIIYLK